MQLAWLPARWRVRAACVGTLVAAAVLAPIASSPVSAADPARQLAAVRAQVDELGNRYFTAKQDLAALDAKLTSLERARAQTERSYAAAHRLAVRRAVARYMHATYVQNDATSVLQAASSNVIIERAAATTNAAMAHYLRVRTSLLDTQRKITQQRKAQQTLVSQLDSRTRQLNRDLASAQRSYRAMLAAQAAAANAKAKSVAKGNTDTVTVTQTPAVPPVRDTPVSTPPPAPPPGTNSHHNDPFLSCVRQRESHGIYSAVNPAGYYGAYQFAATTWNITASHAGRPNLIGVRPDHASAWDQDELAWVLYQWQGMGPWGGGCG